MRTNNIVTKIAAKETPVGFTIRFPSATIVEMMGQLGFDFVMFDSEHGPFTTADIEELARASDAVGLTPMARVPNIHDSTILRFLDRGIMGIMGPHVNTREQGDHPKVLEFEKTVAPTRPDGRGRHTCPHHRRRVLRRRSRRAGGREERDRLAVLWLLQQLKNIPVRVGKSANPSAPMLALRRTDKLHAPVR